MIGLGIAAAPIASDELVAFTQGNLAAAIGAGAGAFAAVTVTRAGAVPPPDGEADYIGAALDLLPPGAAWPRDPESVVAQLLAGVGRAVWRVHLRADDLTEREADPSRTVELLPEWEAAYGLPDPCTPLNATLAGRQAALVAKLVAQGGQTPAYMVQVAGALGIAIRIETFTPARAGQLRAGGKCYAAGWAFVWRVHAAPTTIRYFRAGASTAGEPLATWGNAELECRLRALSPAHTILQFAYDGA